MFKDLTHRIFYDADSPAGVMAGKDVKVDDLSIDQIDDMGQDEIDRVQFDEDADDAILKAPAKEKEEPPVKTDEDPPKPSDEGDNKDKKPEEKQENVKLDEDIKTLEEIPKEDRTDLQVVELRHLNATRRMHQATKEAAAARKENDELKEQIFNKELDQEDDPPEILSKDDYEELPPEEQKIYDAEIKEYGDKQNARAALAASNTFTNIAAFFKALKGRSESVEDIQKREQTDDGKTRLSNAEFREFLKSDEFKKVDAQMKGQPKQYDGTYSVKQMMDAHLIANKDKYLSDAQLAGREQAMGDIDGANNSDASKLDLIPKTEGKKGLKKVSDLSTDEIDDYGQDELNAQVEVMEREGLA